MQKFVIFIKKINMKVYKGIYLYKYKFEDKYAKD